MIDFIIDEIQRYKDSSEVNSNQWKINQLVLISKSIDFMLLTIIKERKP